MRVIQLEQGTDEWLEFRRSGIGSSDIAAICGLSPFARAWDIYQEKQGFGAPQYINSAMQRGIDFESAARTRYNKTYHTNFSPIVCLHDKYDYFLASLDGYDAEKQEILEIKVPTKKTLLYKVANGIIPDYYEAQLQWQMLISNAKCAQFAVYDVEGDEIITQPVERDSEKMELLEEKAHEFWTNFLQGIPPVDERQHINLEFPEEKSRFEEYRSLLDQQSQIKKRLAALKEYLIDLGDDGNWKAYGLTFTKNEGRKTYNIEKMIQDGVKLHDYISIGKPYYTIKKDKDD